MKKGLRNLLWFLILGLASCGGEEDAGEEINEDGHKITGNVTNADGLNVVLYVFEDREERIVDSALVENGSFTLFTDTKELREYIIAFGSRETPIALFLDESSENVTINGELPGLDRNYEVTGSKLSADYCEYLKISYPRADRMFELDRLMSETPVEDQETMHMYANEKDSLANSRIAYAKSYIDQNPSSPVSWVLLYDLIPATGLADFDTLYLDYFEEVSAAMREKYPYSEYPDFITESKNDIAAQITAMNAPRDMAPDLVVADRDGNPLALSSLRGKVVLLDFWASWCGPCRMENPNVVKLYDKYKDKGFTIYSVSLDQDKSAWLKAIESDNLKWPNHVSDLKGWQSEAAAVYGVNSIPATFLIDKDGKLIESGLRGARLEQKLQQIFG